MQRAGRGALDALAVVLAVVLTLPMFRHAGYGLSGDLVFSPHQPLTPETLGLGGRLPRAVPLDAVVSLLGSVVPGSVLFRVAVLAGLVLAGTGAHRALRHTSWVARAAAVVLAVWNPFTVERLALGQWALLLAYGAVVWLVTAAVRERGSVPWATWAWVGLASLTPSGGLLAAAVATVLGAAGRARTLVLAAGCLVLQLPWLVPSLLRVDTGQSDPAGALAFRSQGDAPGGPLVSLLGLGGIWDLDSVPTSRSSVLGVLAAVLVVLAIVAGYRRLPPGTHRLVPVAVVGLLLAVGPSVPGVRDLLAWVIEHVPGGGLLRDAQKWLLPYVVLAVLAFGTAVDRLVRRTRARAAALVGVVGLLAVVAPVALLPDAATRTWDAVTPVRYPAAFERVRSALAADPDHGEVALLPWRTYRGFTWGNRHTAYDPAYAWFDAPLVGSSSLVVGRRVVADQDPRAEEVRRAAAEALPGPALARLGVGWMLVYRDDPDAPDVRTGGLVEVVDTPTVALYRTVEAPAELPASGPPALPVVAVDVLVALAWLVAIGAATTAWGRRRS